VKTNGIVVLSNHGRIQLMMLVLIVFQDVTKNRRISGGLQKLRNFLSENFDSVPESVDGLNASLIESMATDVGIDRLRTSSRGAGRTVDEQPDGGSATGEQHGQWRFRAGAGGHRPSKSWLPPPQKLAVALLTHCGQLILREKITRFDSTRRDILRLKCTKFEFRSAQTQRGELTALL